MFIVRLTGGLGNQMFQYAAARRLSLAINAPLKLDVSAFASDAQRAYALDAFNVQAAVASTEEITRLRGGASFVRRLLHAGGLLTSPTFVREKTLEFDPSLLKRTGETYLEGYWGYENYFADAAAAIRRDFTFRSPARGDNARLAAEIRARNAVCVHVRRGDFVRDPAVRRRLGFCDVRYYEQGIEEIAREIPGAHIYCFSNEPEWIRSAFRLTQPYTIVSGNMRAAAHEDMRLMALCKHHVISNSTFGWWAAWLAKHPEQIVIAPFPWTRIRSLRGKDLMPAGWRLRPIAGGKPQQLTV